MSEKHKSLENAYVMLSVPVIISVITLILLIGVVIYSIAIEQGADGGHWLLFGVIVIAAIFFPCILAAILQVLFYVAGLIKYKKSDVKKVRTYGMICAVSSIVSNAYLVLWGFRCFFSDEAEKDFYPLRIISIIFIIYGVVIVRMLIKSKHAADCN